MKVVAILAFVFVLMTFANCETRCIAPKEWEGRVNTYDHHRGIFTRGHMAYDGKGQRIRIVEDVDINGTSQAFEDIFLFQKQVQYRIDIKTKKCEKSHLTHPFYPIEVHPNSTYVGDYVIGSLGGPGMGVIVEQWGHSFTGGFAIQTFTMHGCNPVQYQMYNETAHYTVDHSYTDLTLGIRDARVFEPPKDCM